MIKHLKFSLILLFVIISSKGGFCKPTSGDFIITLNDEKVYGKVIRNFDFNSSKSIKFDLGDGVEKEFFPNEVIGFGLDNGRYFLSMELPGIEGKVFGQMIVSGTLDLIFYRNIYFIGNKLEKVELKQSYLTSSVEDGKTKNYYIKPYASVINQLMAGNCGYKIRGKINSLKYNEEEFISILVNYHKCENLEYTIHVERIPVFQISPVLSIGFNHLSNFPTSNNYDGKMVFDSNLYLMGQIGVKFHSFRKAPRLSVDLSFGYIIQDNKVNSEKITDEYISTGTDSYTSSSFIIPFFINYSIINLGKVDPYIGFGFTYRTSIIENNFGIHDFTDIPRRATSVYNYYAIGRHGQTISPTIKLGGNVISLKRFGIVAEVQFDYVKGNYTFFQYGSYVPMAGPIVFNELSTSFLLGFRF